MIGVRTDFFLLGILVLELMHGFHPYDPTKVGTAGSLIDNLMNGDYVPPDLARDPVLVTFVTRALQTQPFKRFRTVEALMNHFALERGTC